LRRLSDGERASLSVVAHQFKKGSRKTITRFPDLKKHLSGVPFSQRLFWIVSQLIALPVSSSIDVPENTGGKYNRNGSMIRSNDNFPEHHHGSR
jgi:hypothetical protein